VKALILGGCGKMGALVGQDLIKSDDVTQVILADINLDMAKVPEPVQKSPKVSVEYLDVTESFAELVKAIRGNDIVINCVGPYSAFDPHMTVKAAIEARVDYVDICDDFDATKRIFELDESATEAGVTVCTGLGIGPGTTNMLAKYGADKLDALDEIKILAIIALLDPVGKAGISQALARFIGDAPQYIDGRLTYVPAGSNVEEVTFMEPFGKNEVFCCASPLTFTLPRYIRGVKTISSKMTFYPPSVNQLFRRFVELGLTSTEPLVIGNATVSPRDFIATFIQHTPALREGQKPSISCACNVVVKGREGGNNVTYTYRFGGWSGPLVSISASVCTQMLHRGEVKVKGVVAPEGAFDPKKYFAELAKKGQVLKSGMPFLEERASSGLD
jgi:lysine 6-dehydrogenase